MNSMVLLSNAVLSILFYAGFRMGLASALGVLSKLLPRNQAAGNPPALPAEITTVVQDIGVVENSVFKIATALATMLIVVAGVMIMFDRESSTEKRGQRLAFLRTILIGYGIVLGAHVLISIFSQVVPTGGK
jgi:hypothetical protein